MEAVKDKNTLGIILSVLFQIVFLRYLPALESADVLPRLSLYDAGESQLVAELENSLEFDVYVAHSQDNMEAYVGNKDIVMLGLTLPADFDQTLATAEQVELAGMDYAGVLHVAGAQILSRYEFGVRLLRFHGLDPDPTCPEQSRRVIPARSRESGLCRPLDCTLDCSRARALLRTPLPGVDEVLRTQGSAPP